MNKEVPVDTIAPSYEQVYREVTEALAELLTLAKMKKGDMVVIGCSTSEIHGAHIGRDSREELGRAVFDAAKKLLDSHGLYLAAQCCEHLNRALVIEREAAEHYGYPEVNAVPALHAGGAFAVATYAGLKDAVLVESIAAGAALDIGDSLIGMHLRPVVVPVRLQVKSVGRAHLTAARVRAKYIGGPRANYNEKLF